MSGLSIRPGVRILFTESSKNLGGQEMQALQQMRRLEAAGVSTCLACSGASIAERALKLGLAVENVRFRNSLHLPSLWAMWKLIVNWKPDAIVSHSGHDANIAGMAARMVRNRPVLVRSRTYQPGPPRAWTYNRLADITVVPSGELRRQLLSNPGIIASKIRVLYPGIDFAALERDALEPLPEEIAAWLERRSGPVIVQAAMLRPEKGHLLMLDVIARISRQFAGLRFVIAGTGEQRERIATRIHELGLDETVLLAGMVNPIAPLLCRANLVVLPSCYEPLGMAQSEALALGVPVLASNVGGIPETIADRKTGLLIQSGDPDAWERALTWALSNMDVMQEMASAGRDDVRSRFSVDANMQGLLEAISIAATDRQLAAPIQF